MYYVACIHECDSGHEPLVFFYEDRRDAEAMVEALRHNPRRCFKYAVSSITMSPVDDRPGALFLRTFSLPPVVAERGGTVDAK